MKFAVKRLRVAEEDALQAALWYDDREAGLGDDFLDQVDAAVQSLSENAMLHRVRFADVRRAPVARFKYYGVYYLIRDQEVWVLAVFHGRRHPRWLELRRKDLSK